MGEYFEDLRRKVGKEKILVPGTGAIVLNERDEVLVMLRADDATWGLPGGFMDLGETVRDALHRELREELGITPRGESLFGIYSGPDFDTTHENGDETASVTVVFVVPAFDGVPRGGEESRELRFVPLDALPDPMKRSNVRFIEEYRQCRAGELDAPIIL